VFANALENALGENHYATFQAAKCRFRGCLADEDMINVDVKEIKLACSLLGSLA
jgi:hypothetical protein